MSKLVDAYDSLAISLEEMGVKKSNMFGMPVLKLGRRPIGGLAEDDIMFKLPVDSPEMKLALSLDGAHVFAPSMHGRTSVMKQWVIVPLEHHAHYMDFALRSYRFVSEGE